ncbi:hypothetical protein [Antarctobacter heliothermus]|uniref:hypothetical protein n=1 Tax=Antarctobacter heliothermus TaxID=74033 RepID=UPI0012FE4279|nr:hypothetical protein [Antarctobacter heliothermus]
MFRSCAQALHEGPDLSTANPIFAEIDHPEIGRYLTPGTPFSFEGVVPDTPRPAPRLRQHTEEGLADVADLLSGVVGKLMGDG